MSSRVIPGDQASCQSWAPPDVGASAGGGQAVQGSAVRPPNLLTAEQIEEIQRQAYDEGFAQGRGDGLADGQREIRAQVEHLQQLMATLAAPLEELDQQVEQQLVALSLAVARQLIRREIKTDPGQVVAAVREAIAVLPLAVRKVRIHLHPDDAALVREALAIGEPEQGWQVVEDPVVTRGGCRISTDTSQIDATVEARMQAAITAVMGGERDEDDQP
ncbi:MAG: flagellar assembly protein FliH [Gammaproteobacteria bacterium]